MTGFAHAVGRHHERMISPTTTNHEIKEPSSTKEKLVAAVELSDSVSNVSKMAVDDHEAVLETGLTLKDNELKASESESIDYGSLVVGKEKESESESLDDSKAKESESESVDQSKAKESESVNDDDDDDDQVILEASLIDPNLMKTQENEGEKNVGKISSDNPPAEVVKPFTSVLKDDEKMFPDEGVLEDPSKEPPTVLKPVDPSLETSDQPLLSLSKHILQMVSHVDELDGHQKTDQLVERLTTLLKERLCLSDELNTIKQIDTVQAEQNNSGFELVKKEAADRPTNVKMKSQPAKTANVEMINSLAKMRPKRQTRRPAWLNDFVLGKP